MKTEDLYEEIKIPEGLESRLETLIDELAATESRTKRNVRIRLWTGGIAASIVIALSAGWLLRTEPVTLSVPVSSGICPVDDPEAAYREVKKALELMSVNLNRGLEEIDVRFVNELEKSSEIINKTFVR
jgi:hypothetical protein